MIVLMNTDQDQYMQFAFDTSTKLPSKFVTVTPVSGEIAPTEFAVVRVTTRCMHTAVFDFDIRLVEGKRRLCMYVCVCL